MVKSKLPPRSGCSLEAVEPHPEKGAIKLFFVFFFINSSKEINNEDPKFKIGDIVRIAKYENIFCKRLSSKLV